MTKRGPKRPVVDRYGYTVKRSSGVTYQILLDCGHVESRKGSNKSALAKELSCPQCLRRSPPTNQLYERFKNHVPKTYPAEA